MREIVRRLRREYGLDESAMLEKLRPYPDVTAADVHRWREAGELQHRVIDGQVRYFRREPSNLFRFSEDAKARRVKQDGEAGGLEADGPPGEGDRGGGAERQAGGRAGQAQDLLHGDDSRRRGGAKAGSVVARVAAVSAGVSAAEGREAGEQRAGSRRQIAENGTPQRTMYYERTIEDPSKPIEIKAVFEYVSYAYYPNLKDEER